MAGPTAKSRSYGRDVDQHRHRAGGKDTDPNLKRMVHSASSPNAKYGQESVGG